MPFKIQPRLYGVWQSMRRRCLTPTSNAYKDYGGRGISICPQWDDYATFERDMGERPHGTSIDRRDNDGNYEPGNCRWATKKTQLRNQRRTRYVTIDGVRYKAIELSELSGLKTDTIVDRAAGGFTYAQCIAPPHSTISEAWQAGIRKAIAVRVANQLARKTCKRGHKVTPENTGVTGIGGRYCKVCDRTKVARRMVAQSQ
jgi:hypothetical protein